MFRHLSSAAVASRAQPRLFSTTDEAFLAAWKTTVPNIEPPITPLSFMRPRPPTPSSKLTFNFRLPYASHCSHQEVGFQRKAKQENCFLQILQGKKKKDKVTSIEPFRSPMAFLITTQQQQVESTTSLSGVSTIDLQVDMVIVPATTGQMGILPGHVATIAELKPGDMSVHEGNEMKKYFVSSGFAFVHANSIADIIAIEAVPVDQIDPIAVQKGLAEFAQKLNPASTDKKNAEAQIGVDVLSALSSAVSA